MRNELLCTRRDFEHARSLLLKYFQENGIATRRELSRFKVFGLPYESIELAVRDLRAKGSIEELYVLPRSEFGRGQRPEYWGLTVALDAKAITLPEGVIRESTALGLIADYEEAV